MKTTGIVRQLDNLGRVVIPMEIRKVFDIPAGTPMEIYVEGDSIVLHKHQNKCVVCGGADNITEFKGKVVCKECIDFWRSKV